MIVMPVRSVVGGTLPAAIWRQFVREVTPIAYAGARTPKSVRGEHTRGRFSRKATSCATTIREALIRLTRRCGTFGYLRRNGQHRRDQFLQDLARCRLDFHLPQFRIGETLPATIVECMSQGAAPFGGIHFVTTDGGSLATATLPAPSPGLTRGPLLYSR
jgi:hypothetical protein